MRQKPILKICMILWGVFLIGKLREGWYDVRSFLNEEQLVGFLQGWGPVSGIIRTWAAFTKEQVQYVCWAELLFDCTVMGVLPTMDRKLGKIQSYLCCGYMLLYIPRCLMVAGAFLGLRGVKPGGIYILMLFPAVCAVILLCEIVRDKRASNF